AQRNRAVFQPGAAIRQAGQGVEAREVVDVSLALAGAGDVLEDAAHTRQPVLGPLALDLQLQHARRVAYGVAVQRAVAGGLTELVQDRAQGALVVGAEAGDDVFDRAQLGLFAVEQVVQPTRAAQPTQPVEGLPASHLRDPHGFVERCLLLVQIGMGGFE
ncbi:hypothetical protein RZS08_15105, partial [Arthrospira platensis SPKY1]|nr:hypothetical protein [Arthrospira platensis SPKY1]